MNKLLIVLFREFLEISLIINMIYECTKIIKGSRIYIFFGLVIGSIISLIFSYFIENISKSFSEYGEEIFNIIILIITSIAILYTVIWIKINQSQIQNKSSDTVDKISNQNYSKFTISFIVASSLLREFIEIALLSYGIITSSGELNTQEYLLTLILGGGGGLLFGLLVYKTLKSIMKRYLFKIFTIMLILIAAGMCAEAAKIATSSGIITILSDPIWNINSIISEKSLIAKLLKLLSIGYSSSPSIIETIFYFIPIAGFFIFSKKVKGK